MTERTATVVDNPVSEPTLLSSAWRFRWLVLGTTALAAALGVLFTTLRPPVVTYTARASFVIQTTAGGLDLGTSGSPQRFVANQVEILRSAAVADRAAELAAQVDPPVQLSPDTLQADALVSGSSKSDLIQVLFTANDPDAAIAGANALVGAYRQLLASGKAKVAAAATAQIDGQLDDLDSRLRTLADQIDARRASDPTRSKLRLQYEGALAEIVDLQSEARTADAERLGEIRLRLGDLRNLISTYQAIQGIGLDDMELTSLQSERDQILARKAALLDRRDTISVDVQGSEDIVAFESLARSAAESGGSESGRVLAVAVVLGMIGGVGIAYLLATRREVFHDRTEPEAILEAPLLAEIPEFSEEGIHTQLPVRDRPRSASAEAFRFAATSIELRLHKQGIKTLVVLSATLGAGKSTVLANTALAAAREGNRVLLIDADFGNQALTALLAGDEEWLPCGLTDVVAADLALEDAISTLDIGQDAQLFLLTRGRQPVGAADLVKSPEVQSLFEAVREQFDIIFVDAPPLLQVAYASTLASYGDAVMMIVEHKGSAAQLREARTRLNLIGAPLLGYLYNRSPLRREMTSSEGSMADILGDRGMLDIDDEPTKPTSGTRWRH